MDKYNKFIQQVKDCCNVELYNRFTSVIDELKDNDWNISKKLNEIFINKLFSDSEINQLYDAARKKFDIKSEKLYTIVGYSPLNDKTQRNKQRAFEIYENKAAVYKKLSSQDKLMLILGYSKNEIKGELTCKLKFTDWIDYKEKNILNLKRFNNDDPENKLNENDYLELMGKLENCRKFISNNDEFMLLNSIFELGHQMACIKFKPLNNRLDGYAKTSVSQYERLKETQINIDNEFLRIEEILSKQKNKISKMEAFRIVAKESHSNDYKRFPDETVNTIKTNYYRKYKKYKKNQ